MSLSSLTAISPVDGRYHEKTKILSDYFSEFALIRYRVVVEIEYLLALSTVGLTQLPPFTEDEVQTLRRLGAIFSTEDAQLIKTIERSTNHDVKAVEYFLKEKLEALGFESIKEFVHFGLTSQDINNTAVPCSVKEAMDRIYEPVFQQVVLTLQRLANDWKDIPMLARTHGQPASPTRLGKEIKVFQGRLEAQKQHLKSIPHAAKFGGATGNFNAHFAAYPEIDWHAFAEKFLRKQLGLQRSFPTTQIEHYDHLAALCHALLRINTILIDLCRDFWTYISMEYFKQKIKEGEVGSSAMPHKVNPIDFENAEGNLGLANALFAHLAEKLPISRLQRDLTDSTVLRNIGVPFAHTLIAFQSILKGMDKLVLNEPKLLEDLENNWMVVAEGIQTILRREGFQQPYEALKTLTRGQSNISKIDIHRFIDALNVSQALKVEMKKLSPFNYLGE